MLEDLRLLVVIIGLVGFAFLVLSSIRKRWQNRNITEKFDKRIFEKSYPQSEDIDPDMDPLFNEQSQPQKPSLSKRNSQKILQKASKKSKGVEDVIIFSIKPRTQGGFSGRTLEAVLNTNHFFYGDKKIFHKHAEDDQNNPVMFSLAQSVEPGHFDLEQIKKQRVAGLVLFMILPSDYNNPIDQFNKMLKSARQLAAALNGELCDSQQNHITSQTLGHYRELVQEAQRKLLAQKAE